MNRWVSFGGGVAAGVAVGIGWLVMSRDPPGVCRVLEVDVGLPGADDPSADRAFLPVGTQLVVVGVEEIDEARVPVRLPAGTPSHACEDDRPEGLHGMSW